MRVIALFCYILATLAIFLVLSESPDYCHGIQSKTPKDSARKFNLTPYSECVLRSQHGSSTKTLQQKAIKLQNISLYFLSMFIRTVHASQLVVLMPKFGYGAQNLFLTLRRNSPTDLRNHCALLQCILDLFLP